MIDQHLTVRTATRHDRDALSRLGRLDGRPFLAGRVLLAERDDVALAALSLTSGRVAADPSPTSLDAVRRLRLCRYRLLHQGGGHARPARSPLRRPAPLAAA